MEYGLTSMQQDVLPQWEEVESYLRAIEPSSGTDDYIDELAERVFDAPHISQAEQALVVALDRAQSTLTRRSIALALALCAASDSRHAVDGLVAAYRQCNGEPFLAPSILEALSILALRNPLARAEIVAGLFRLDLNDSRHLLVRAAKVIGRLNNVQPEAALRNKLQTLCTATDLAVQSEAYYQLGLITLAEAFLASDSTELHQQLSAAQAAFVQAEMTEESRDDAALFQILLDAVITIHALTDESPEMVRRVVQDTDRLQIKLQQINTRIWRDYRSPYAELMAIRVLGIVDALKRAMLSASAAEDWTNFDAALIDLATLHALIRVQTPASEISSRISAPLQIGFSRRSLAQL